MLRLSWRRCEAAPFRHPLDPAPRTAILRGNFRLARGTRIFPSGWSDAARQFAPAVVAGTYADLLRVAADSYPVSHALVVFGDDPRRRLGALRREHLWKAFGVPVYEQYLDQHNSLLAWECDAHADLHTTSTSAPGSVLCACGDPAPLLRYPEERQDTAVPGKRYAAQTA